MSSGPLLVREEREKLLFDIVHVLVYEAEQRGGLEWLVSEAHWSWKPLTPGLSVMPNVPNITRTGQSVD